MDHQPPSPPLPDQIQPRDYPLNPPNTANAAPQPTTSINHGDDEEQGPAQKNLLPMKNFRDLVFKFIKPLTPTDESLIEQRLSEFFPAILTVPDHPPYSAMIEEAVEKLNGGRGSSEKAISEYIKNKYYSLPWAHPTILAHHLNKLSKKGDIIMRFEQGYILRSVIVGPSPSDITAPIGSPSSSLGSDYSPCSSSPSSSGTDSPSPRRRRLNRKGNRKKSQIQGRGRGRPRNRIPGRGPGRPRKKDGIDGQLRVHDEKLMRKRVIQTREGGGSQKTIQGRQRGRPRKNDMSEGYQLREERVDVTEENHQVMKEDNQLVLLEDVIENHNQVADMEMEEIEGNNEVQVQNEVLLERSKADAEPNLASRSGSQRRGAVEEREKHEKQKKVISEVQIQPEERQKEFELNEQAAERQLIVDQTQTVPDYPLYPVMIEEAIKTLNGGRGSSEEAILGYIKNEYEGFPWAHQTILAHHLNKLCEKGDIMRCEWGYILRSAIISSNIPASFPSPSPSLGSEYCPGCSSYSSSSGSDCRSSGRRCSKRKRSIKKSQTQGRGKGRPRNNIPGRGPGRPRKKDEIDGQFRAHDEKLNGKRMIQKRERGWSRKTIPGSKRGRPRKNNKTSEGYLLREEQTDVAEEHYHEIKEDNQPVELKDFIQDQNQVAEMKMKEIKENNEVQVQNQVVLEQSKAEDEHNLAVRSEPQGRGAVEEREKHQKQEKVVSEAQIQPEEQHDDGLHENEQAAEREVIVDQNQPWKQEDRVISGQDQREELHRYMGDEQDVVMAERVEHANELSSEYSRQQNQEKDASIEHIHSEDDNIMQVQYGSIEQHMEVIEEQIHPCEENGVASLQDKQREIGFEVNEGECQEKEQQNEIAQERVWLEFEGKCQEKEQQNEIAQERVRLEFEVSEGKCQEEERQTEVIQVEAQLEDKAVEGRLQEEELQNEVVQADVDLEDEVIEEQQDLNIIINEPQEDEEGWNGQREEDKGGSLEHNESEKRETDAIEEHILEREQPMDVIIDKIQQCGLQEKEILEQDQIQRLGVEVAKEPYQQEELHENDALKEKYLQPRQLMDVIEDRLQQCELQEKEILEKDLIQRQKVEVAEELQKNAAPKENVLLQERLVDVIEDKFQQCDQLVKEILEQDQLRRQKVEVAEEVHQQQELQAEVFQEEMVQEEEMVEEQLELGMIRYEEIEDDGVEKLSGQQKQVKGASVVQKELEEHLDDVIGEQVQAQEKCMEGTREKIQPCEQDNIAEQEAEVAEGIHQQEEQQNEEISAGELALKENVLLQKRLMGVSVDNVQQCEQEREILEQDQLRRQKVEVAEEVHQQHEIQAEVFQEEIVQEVEEQLEVGMMRYEATEDDGVEKLSGQQEQVKGASGVQKELEEHLNGVIGEQVQPLEKCMEGTREKIQPCERDDIAEQECLSKEEAEGIHQKEEQQNEEVSAGEIVDGPQDLGTTRSEAEGGSAEEWSRQQKEETGERAEVNHLEEHENDDSEKQNQAQEQCSEENKEKLQACELHQRIIMEPNDRKEQELEIVDREQHPGEELYVEAFEEENQLQGKRNVNVVSLQSCDVCSSDLKALPCKSFWSLMEEEKDKFLNNFRDQESKSPCREREISDCRIKGEQELLEVPLIESSPKSRKKEVSSVQNPRLRTRLQHAAKHRKSPLSKSKSATTASRAKVVPNESLQPGHGGNGRSPEMKICFPGGKESPLPDYQNKSEERLSVREGLRPRNRDLDAVATSENQQGERQPVRRSPRHLTHLEAGATTEELEHSKERPKRPGLRSEKNKNA